MSGVNAKSTGPRDRGLTHTRTKVTDSNESADSSSPRDRRHLSSKAGRASFLVCALVASFVISLTLCSAPSANPAPILETPAAPVYVRVWQAPESYAASGVAVQPPTVTRNAPQCIRPRLDERGGVSRPKTPEWTHEDRAQTRRVIDAIAREMGANLAARRLLLRIADRESVGTKPWQIHVHPNDVAYASSDRARAYVADKLGREFTPDWSYGRGLYGMQPWLYIERWDPSADLDVLCDPVASTVIAIWVMRRQSWRCKRDGYQPTVEISNRAWGSGNCAERPLRDARERAWWGAHGSSGWDFDAIAYWGGKSWPESSERGAVLARMREVSHAAKG